MERSDANVTETGPLKADEREASSTICAPLDVAQPHGQWCKHQSLSTVWLWYFSRLHFSLYVSLFPIVKCEITIVK